MEKLVYMAFGVLAASTLGLGAGLWLLHTAFNDGNFWKGLVAAILTVVSGAYFTITVGALGGSR